MKTSTLIVIAIIFLAAIIGVLILKSKVNNMTPTVVNEQPQKKVEVQSEPQPTSKSDNGSNVTQIFNQFIDEEGIRNFVVILVVVTIAIAIISFTIKALVPFGQDNMY